MTGTGAQAGGAARKRRSTPLSYGYNTTARSDGCSPSSDVRARARGTTHSADAFRVFFGQQRLSRSPLGTRRGVGACARRFTARRSFVRRCSHD